MLRDTDTINALELFIASGGTVMYYYSKGGEGPKRVVDIKRVDAWGTGAAETWDDAVKAAFAHWRERYRII